MDFLEQNYLTIMIIVAYLVSFLGSTWLVKVCHKVFDADKSVERQHKGAVPSGGGIGFAPLILLFLIPMVFLEYSSFDISLYLLVMLLGSIIIFVLGFMDDKHQLSCKSRLIAQVVAVLLATVVMPDIWPGIPEFIEKPIIIFGWVWFVNLYNFMDGIDGYSSMQTIFISIMASFIVPVLAPMFAIVAVVMLGFLRVNAPLPKAKIFMGDTGSTFLGYLLGGMLFAGASFDGSYAFSFMTITLLFLVDATQTLLKRFCRGQKPLMLAHQEHWFARMYALKFSHKKILGLGMLLNFSLSILVFVTYDNVARFVSPFIGCLLFTILARYVIHCEKKSGIAISGFKK